MSKRPITNRTTSTLALLVAVLIIGMPERGRAQQPPRVAPGRIIGFVSDSTGHPIAGAQIVTVGARTAVSDSSGNFIVRDVPAGRVLILVRKLGFAPLALDARVPSGGTTSVPVMLAPYVYKLDTVVSNSRENGLQMPDYHGSHKFDLFYQRRASAISGTFFTHDDIARRFPVKLSDLLRGAARRLPRCHNSIMGSGDGGDAGSIYQLFIDGLPHGSAGQDFTTLDAIPPILVEGMAVYTSPTQLPVEAMGNGCAAIFIWTRSVVTDSGML